MKRLAAALTFGLTALVAHPAATLACGGCFGPPRPVETQQVVTDHRMVLAIPAEPVPLERQGFFYWDWPLAVGVDQDEFNRQLREMVEGRTGPNSADNAEGPRRELIAPLR